MDVLADHLYFALRLVSNFVARLIRFRSYRRRPRYARVSSRSSQTVVSLNAQLIYRVFSQRLSRTLPSVSVRDPPRRTYCLLDTKSSLLD